METIQVLDAASSAALLGATVAQADGVLYVVGGHDRGPQRPEDSDPWLRVTAIDANGDGSQVYADGAKYAGEWHGGRRNGTGDCLFASRDHYVGKWVADRRCGRGSCVYASGSKYDGEWRDDERHGAGVHVDDNGRYDGDWVKDREQGRGTWVGIGRPDHEKEYDGDWKAGGRHGADQISPPIQDGETTAGQEEEVRPGLRPSRLREAGLRHL